MNKTVDWQKSDVITLHINVRKINDWRGRCERNRRRFVTASTIELPSTRPLPIWPAGHSIPCDSTVCFTRLGRRTSMPAAAFGSRRDRIGWRKSCASVAMSGIGRDVCGGPVFRKATGSSFRCHGRRWSVIGTQFSAIAANGFLLPVPESVPATLSEFSPAVSSKVPTITWTGIHNGRRYRIRFHSGSGCIRRGNGMTGVRKGLRRIARAVLRIATSSMIIEKVRTA